MIKIMQSQKLINKQLRKVLQLKDNGIAVLEQDVITPTVKPQAKQRYYILLQLANNKLKSNASFKMKKM